MTVDIAGLAAASGPCHGANTRTCLYAFGGQNQGFNILSSTMMYDSVKNAWTYEVSLNTARDNFAGTDGPCSNFPSRPCLFAIGGAGKVYTSSVEEYWPGG